MSQVVHFYSAMPVHFYSALDIGIQEFIMKPFVATQVANTVRKVLDQKKSNE